MKRLFAAIVVILTVLSIVPARVLADQPVDLSRASAALLTDAATGRVILEKNVNEPVEVAGLKRLPALLAVCTAFDRGILDADTTVTVSPEAAKIKGVTAFLSPNERIYADALLKASVMLTAGDAVYSLLCAAYGTEAACLEAVNGILGGIGASELTSDSMGTNDRLTLSDLSKICLALAKSEAYLKYSSVYLDTLEHENAKPTELTNPNRLVRFYSGCFGLATGSVGSTEYSGAFIATRGTTTFLAIVAGLPDSSSRFSLATDLLDHGFAAYRSVTLGSVGETVASIPVVGGTEREVELVTGGTVAALMPVADTKLVTETRLPESVAAPVREGECLGVLILKNSAGEKIGEVPVTAKTSVDKADFREYFLDMLYSWLGLE